MTSQPRYMASFPKLRAQTVRLCKQQVAQLNYFSEEWGTTLDITVAQVIADWLENQIKVSWSEEDKCFIARIKGHELMAAHGDTEAEARSELLQAIELAGAER